MNKFEERILVLEEDIDHDEFVRVANKLGWVNQKTHQGDGIKNAFQDIWSTPDKTKAIYFIDDPLTGTHFLCVRGSYLRELLFEIYGRFPAYEQEELFQMAAEAEEHDEAVQAVLRIAVGFPNYDPRAVKVFEAYLTAPSPLLRKATIQAIAYRMWDENIKLLEKTAREDSDESVKQFAQRALDEFKQQLQTN